ncbi:MAG: Imm27 family immunity protein [Methylobacter sp.]
MTEQLHSEETELLGQWVAQDNSIHADEVSKRIEALTKHCLKEVAVSDKGWEILYKDMADGRYWELSYPDSESHGGGAPKLAVISLEETKLKYNLKNK